MLQDQYTHQTATPLRQCNCAVRTREKARARRRSISSILPLLTLNAGVKRRQSGCGALSSKLHARQP